MVRGQYQMFKLLEKTHEFDSKQFIKSLFAIFIHSKDANLVHHVATYFKKKGIDIFTLHDAFFLPANHGKDLLDSVKKLYQTLLDNSDEITKLMI